jgi:Family of unknown function (DUF5808)
MAKDRRGSFLGMPYDWRKPTVERSRERKFNPDDRRVFTPKSYGWGYTINFGALWARLTGRR